MLDLVQMATLDVDCGVLSKEVYVKISTAVSWKFPDDIVPFWGGFWRNLVFLLDWLF